MKKGFTLFEMLAASVLSAMLVMAVLSVVASLNRSQRLMADQVETAWRADGLVQALRCDLTHAERISQQRGLLRIEGLCALDPQTLAPIHEPAIVEYQLRQSQNYSYLLRRQRSPRQEPTEAWSELVASSVGNFHLMSLGADGQFEPIPEHFVPAPKRVQLMVGWTDPNRRPVDVPLVSE